ncbi:MAG: hypothetical protein M1834_002543 [Cirrosporium novae-zelandiae]|nr:MAG: hypothetical protein M1834_002543 [Cirrosporium novae-zelandiae]
MLFSVLLAAAGSVGVALCSTTQKRTSTFEWFGVNESGAEFGTGTYPGTLGTNYIWPYNSTITTLVSDGFNAFRIPFSMERLIPDEMTGDFASAYLEDMKELVNHITLTKGAYAILDPHNFGRYYSTVFTSTSDFKAFWTKVAGEFKDNSKVIFDVNNEFHDEEESNVVALNQAAINGIRAAGATTQYIFVEGNSYSGAWTWATVNDDMKDLTDTQDKIIYEMHQYLDSDGSGTSSTCVSSTIGKERITAATQWLIDNGKKGVLGEYAGGANSDCLSAVKGMLNYMADNTDVWMGAFWWGGGPWWGDYIYSFEPPSGTAYTYYLSSLESFV